MIKTSLQSWTNWPLKWRAFFLLTVAFLCFSIPVHDVKSQEIKINHSGEYGNRQSNHCGKFRGIKLLESGLVRLSFLRNDYHRCNPFIVHNVRTDPKDGRRDVGGFVEGTNEVKGQNFWI